MAPRSPNLNSYAERFVRTIKESCLERMILYGEDALRTAVKDLISPGATDRSEVVAASAGCSTTMTGLGTTSGGSVFG